MYSPRIPTPVEAAMIDKTLGKGAAKQIYTCLKGKWICRWQFPWTHLCDSKLHYEVKLHTHEKELHIVPNGVVYDGWNIHDTDWVTGLLAKFYGGTGLSISKSMGLIKRYEDMLAQSPDKSTAEYISAAEYIKDTLRRLKARDDHTRQRCFVIRRKRKQ